MSSSPQAPVVMDSRKFLGALNDSAQAKITFFEQKIREMGQRAGGDWQLAALRRSNLIFEDTTSGQYYMANHRQEKGGKVTIDNITPIRVVEQQKEKLFQESCLALVKAVETNDQRGMAAAFSKMEAQRFSGRVVPACGRVRTRDGKERTIPIATEALESNVRNELIAAIVENLKDRVLVENGAVVGGTFVDGKPIKLPVTKWSAHKLVARQLREAAQNAYWSQGFQKRVYHVASLIHEDKLEDAVRSVTPFLQENEEFTLLTRAQTKTLVENALAALGIFNQQLCDDTALLVYRTNLRINRDTIVKEWRACARRAQHPTLLENVRILDESKNFEVANDRFLTLIFEAVSNREVTAGALATTLEVLRDRTPKIKESHELASKLNDLIGRLKEKEFDDRAIYEAEDFIATVQEELTSGDDLQSFDQMPGDIGAASADPSAEDPAAQQAGGALSDALGGEEEEEQKQNKQPSIVINAPLISIGGADATGAGGLGGGDLGGGGEEEGGEDLDALLGGAGEEEDQGQADLMAGGQGAMESKGGRRKAVKEEWDTDKYGPKPWEKKSKDGKGEDSEKKDDAADDDDDAYKFDESELSVDPRLGMDYGKPALGDRADVRRITETMLTLAKKHNLGAGSNRQDLATLAQASMEAVGMRVPARKQSAAVDQLIAVFKEEVEQDDENWGDDWPEGDDGRRRIPGIEHGTDKMPPPEAPEDDGPSEAQFKWGTRRRRARERNKHRPEESVDKTQIRWLTEQEDAVLGQMGGIKFIFDHGGADPNLEPVISSVDGKREVPIPVDLHDSAFAAAGMVEGHDPAPFRRWLAESIEQFRPLSEADLDFGPDEMMDEPGMAGAPETIDPGMEDELEPEMEPEMEMEPDADDMEGAVVRIAATGDGGVTVDVAPGTTVNGQEMGGVDDIDADGIDNEVDDEPLNASEPGMEMDDDSEGMEPVNSTAPPMDDEMGGEMGGETDGMPNFEQDQLEEPEGPEGPEEPAEDPRRRRREFGEDEDITSPKSTKYRKHVNEKSRGDEPDAPLPPKSDDKLRGFESVTKGDKNGTKTNPARPRSED